MKITERLYKIFPATFPRFHITIERWKFNDEYKVWVSNQGNVLSENKEPIRALVSSKKYMVFRIKYKIISAHRLVLSTWRPVKDMDKLTVDHINSNVRDNRLCNLEWVTEEENKRRAVENFFSIPLTEEEKDIQKTKAIVEKKIKEKAENFGLSKQECSVRKLDILTKRFKSGEISIVNNSLELNYISAFDYANKNCGTVGDIDVVARRLVCAAYRSGKYMGKHWKFKGNIEISKEEILNVQRTQSKD